MTTPRRYALSAESWAQAASTMSGRYPAPAAYAIIFIDDDGSPTSIVATFPGPMSAEMYGRIAGGRFRLVRADPAQLSPRHPFNGVNAAPPETSAG